jgi:hypothetical protein
MDDPAPTDVYPTMLWYCQAPDPKRLGNTEDNLFSASLNGPKAGLFCSFSARSDEPAVCKRSTGGASHTKSRVDHGASLVAI